MEFLCKGSPVTVRVCLLVFDIENLESSVTSGRGSVRDWMDKAEAIRRMIQEVQDRGNKDRLSNRLECVIKTFRGGDILNDIWELESSVTSGRGSVRDWMDEAEAIRRRIQGVQDRGMKDRLSNRLECVIKTFRGGDILNDIWELESSVTSGRGSVRDWMDEAEAIRRRIQGVQDRGMKDGLSNRLECVVERIRERAQSGHSIEEAMTSLLFDVTRGFGTINECLDGAEAMRRRIRKMDSWEERNKFSNQLSEVKEMIRDRVVGSIANIMESLLSDITSGFGTPSEWTDRAEVVKRKIRDLNFGAGTKKALEGKLSQILTIINKRGSSLSIGVDRQLLGTLILCLLAFLLSLDLSTGGTGSLLGKRSTSVWQVILLRSGDVEANPGPSRFIIVLTVIASLLMHAMALLGRTECQLKSSSAGRDWLEVHCSAEDIANGDDGHIICYESSDLLPLLQKPIHEGGMVKMVFAALLPSPIHCCSDNGYVVGPDVCLDFVDENPTLPPTTRSPPTSASSTLSSTSPKAMTTPVSSWSTYSQSDVTQGVVSTSRQSIAIACASSIVGSFVVMFILAATFPDKFISACTKIKTIKANWRVAREEGDQDVEETIQMNTV